MLMKHHQEKVGLFNQLNDTKFIRREKKFRFRIEEKQEIQIERNHETKYIMYFC